ncbi:9648_t:CDS:2 [Funneliformis mosseae]|uniref:9648_t:CDS:1 n=1 Tax=Funneliformis mosseae TaxID=27381 RepID=A0A9N8YN15_FUNMO|nr:9648_t:CDS:2 [Funneliformis mosseae]
MSKNGSFSPVNETVGVDEKFEMINEQLKYCTLEINGIFTNLFELDKFGKLVPIPLTPFRYNVIVTEGGFHLETGEIRTPKVAFTPDFIRRNLTYEQLNTFHGKPFSPTFVVEVDDVENIDSEKFKQLDVKFKESYFDPLTSIQLGWLIDPFTLRSGSTSETKVAMFFVVTVIGVIWMVTTLYQVLRWRYRE